MNRKCVFAGTFDPPTIGHQRVIRDCLKIFDEAVVAVMVNTDKTPLFTEEEADVYKRGRNAKKPTKSKNASVAEYNRSTGLEAVFGYLYLTGQYDRISQLLDSGEEKGKI